MYKLFFLSFVLLAQTTFAHEKMADAEYSRLQTSCEEAGGIWLQSSLECEVNDEGKWCDKEYGHYEECASPCRNDESAAVCIERCVSVCGF